MSDPIDFKNAFDAVPLLNLGPKGELPPSRVADAASLRNIHEQIRLEDRINAYNRSKMDMLLNGEPPLNQQELDNEGLSEMANINIGGAAAELELAQVPYWARIQATDNLVAVKTKYGEKSKRSDWESIMDEEITRTIRSWPGFAFNTLEVNRKFIWDGLGIAHFENHIDWRFRASRLGEFYFQRQTVLFEDALEITTAFVPYSPTGLYANIKNEEIATNMGWNVPAVKRAIKKAASGNPRSEDWEYLVDQLKNNDLGVSTTMAEVRCIIGYWKEFDGTITFGICTETAVDKDDFLYIGRSRYSSMQEALILFPYGLGTNSKTHGIRGMNYKIYQLDMRRNLFMSKMIDCGERQSGFIVKAADEGSMSELALQSTGNYSVLNPNFSIQQMPPLNLEQGVVPVLREMDSLIARRFGSYAASGSMGSTRKTKAESEDEIAQRSKLSTISMDYWDGPFSRLMRQVVKRMSRKNYMPAEPGGLAVAELRLRLKQRDVPLEAFYQLDHESTQIVKAIGNGSKSEKIQVLEHLQTLAPGFDDTGKRKLLRMQTVAITGDPDMADQLIPRDDAKRTPPDTKIAMLENEQLIQGKPVPVLDGELHTAHAEVHVGALADIWKAYSQGQMPIEEYAMKGRELHDHAAEHVEKISGDPMTEQQAAQYRQTLQQLGEDISNGLKAIQAQQRQQAEAQQQAQQQGKSPDGQQPQQGEPQQQDQGPDVEKIAKFERYQAELKFASEKHAMKMQQMIQEGQLKRQLADAAQAAKIAREGVQ